MERKITQTKINRKLLVCTLLAAILLSGTAVSMASATEDTPMLISGRDVADENAPVSDDTPILDRTQDDSTELPEDETPLDRSADDNTVAPEDDSTLYTIQEDDAEDNQLVIAQAQPDYTVAILGAVALLAAIAVGAVVLVIRHRKKA